MNKFWSYKLEVITRNHHQIIMPFSKQFLINFNVRLISAGSLL